MGRQSTYSDEVAGKICERLMTGEPLKVICADESMPCYITVLKWQRDFPEFANLSARAKMDGTHALADDSLKIADDMTIDVAHKRVMIDTRLRLIGKWNSKVYGDKLALGGADDLPPVKAAIDVSKLSTDAMAQILAAVGDAAPETDTGGPDRD